VKRFFKRIFEKIDTDSSGALDKHELEAAIEKLATTVDGIPELPFSEQQVVACAQIPSCRACCCYPQLVLCTPARSEVVINVQVTGTWVTMCSLLDANHDGKLDFDEAWGMFVKVCGGEMILEGSLRLMPLQVHLLKLRMPPSPSTVMPPSLPQW